MIPKIIHYCWFGGNPKSEIIEKCIASWKKYCPDWEIIEWNEGNFDVNLCKYTRNAFENKRWAFLSDVARLYVVNKAGGVYLDTDVELNAPIENWLNYNSFFVFDNRRYIGTGYGFGAEANNKIVESMLNDYFDDELEEILCTHLNTKSASKVIDIPRMDITQVIENNLFISEEDYNAIAKHHSTWSWDTEENKAFREKRSKKHKILKRIFRNKAIRNRFEKNLQSKAAKIYFFVAYDLLESGVMYYFKKLCKKLKKHK